MNPQIFDPENTPIAGTMLLEASAGTGKTYALERMAARLIGRKNNPLSIEQILVVTFTNRAAREMKERIRKIIGQRAQEKDRDAAQRNQYKAALTAFDNAAIFTIHSFCRMVLSTWPFESSAPFQQDLVPGGKLEIEEARTWLASPDTSAIDSQVLEAAYRQAGSSQKLVKATAKLLRDEAVPMGSIQTPTDSQIDAFGSFCADSRDPQGHLSIAADKLFSQPWSDEAMKSLFAAAGGPSKKAGSLDRIRAHIAACRELRGIPALTDGLFGDPSETKVGKHFLELLFAAKSLPGGADALEPEARKLLAAARSLIAALEPYIEFRSDSRSGTAVNLINRYMQCLFDNHAREILTQRVEARKNEIGIWGYGDLIRRVSDAVKDPRAPLKNLLRARFKATLIDEFQDTDPRQWQMFQTLFNTPGHVLALIGDPKQSIYGFRGTGLQGYNIARNLVPEKNRYRLDTNYRSRASLVAGVNRLFEPLFRTCSGGGKPIGFLPVNSGRHAGERLDWPNADKAIALMKAETANVCAEGITREIRAMLDPKTGARWFPEKEFAETGPRPLLASDIAVLVRSARQEEDIITRLSALGVPAVRFRSRSVFAQPITEALQDLLEAFEHPRNQSLWRGVLLGEFFRLPPDLLLRFEEAGYLDHFAEEGMGWRKRFILGRSNEAFESFFSFTTLLGKWARGAGRGDVGNTLLRPWTKRVLSEPDGERQWQDWRQICELIQQKQFDGLRDIPGIITWMRRCADEADPEGSQFAVRLETETPAVRVMTMHTAKGLEFPLVFLYGGYTEKTKRQSDTPYRFDDNGTLVIDRICREENLDRHRAYAWEEDKRLWYVAFTRAAYKLWVPLPSGEGNAVQLDSLWDLAEHEMNLPPHESMGAKDAAGFREQLLLRVQELVDASDFIHVFEPETSEPPVLPQPEVTLGQPAPLPADYTGIRDPSAASYTALVRQTEDRVREAPSEDEPMAETVPLPEDRGSVFGSLIHACLEKCDFTLARDDDERVWLDHPETESLFAELAGRCYPPDWYGGRASKLKSMVRRALRAPIPILGRLCDLEAADYRSEIEFQVYVPESSQVLVDDSEIRIEKGFLKGFIDLLVRRDGLWWIVDWKTNIPQAGQDYGEIMNRHHYHFQYELYLLGLCRALSGNSGRPVVWESEIGGAVYLFLRGLTEHDDTGICMNKPPLERMLSIAENMNCLGVLE